MKIRRGNEDGCFKMTGSLYYSYQTGERVRNEPITTFWFEVTETFEKFSSCS